MRDMFRHQGWERCFHLCYNHISNHRILPGEFCMEQKRHVVTIVIDDIETAFNPVSDLLHTFAPHILLRVGYPMRDKNVSVIFLVMELDLDQLGSFSGKLGQIPTVKVKTITLKI